jgi:acetylornithine deacetylase/succinyl-diaminopimelate desuccinylase-like protein
MSVNVRCTRPEERESIMEFIREITGLEVEYVSGRPPLAVRNDAEELDLLAEVMAKHFGKKPGFTRMNGATDACHFAAGSAPVAIIGIRFSGAHAKSERASLASLERYSLMLGELAQVLR